MSETTVTLSCGPEFRGELKGEKLSVPVGKEYGGLSPYELLLGALGGCYYSTFLDIVKKKRLTFQRAAFTIRGVKRDEVPTTLKEVSIDFTLYGAADEKGFARCAELAAKYCSVHETISKVAHIETRLHFESQD